MRLLRSGSGPAWAAQLHQPQLKRRRPALHRTTAAPPPRRRRPPPAPSDPGDVAFEDDNGLRFWVGPGSEKLSEDPTKMKYSWCARPLRGLRGRGRAAAAAGSCKERAHLLLWGTCGALAAFLNVHGCVCMYASVGAYAFV